MDKDAHPAVRLRPWHRRLSTLIRKAHPHPVPLPLRPPTPSNPPRAQPPGTRTRASSAPPSRIQARDSTSTPTATTETRTHTEIRTQTQTPQTETETEAFTEDLRAEIRGRAREADWSTVTPSTEYDEGTTGSCGTEGTERPAAEVVRLLEYAFRPVEQRPLLVDLVGEEGGLEGLKEVCRVLAGYSLGVGVIGNSVKESLAKHPIDGISRLAERDAHFAPNDDLPGPTPSLQQVHEILLAGKECQRQWHSLAGWNLKVHARLLSLALHSGEGPRSPKSCSYMPCSSAKLIKRYRCHPSPPTPPTYTLYLDPASPHLPDPAARARIESIRRYLPYCMMNHLDYTPLRRRPVTLAIVTTEPGEGLAEANLRMAGWHAAQWNFLAEVSRVSGGDVGVGFVPGVVVQGGDWSFVASSREGNKTILWTKMYIGSTNSILGIYQIVRALQYLAKWSLEVYWPWYRRVVLELSPDLI